MDAYLLLGLGWLVYFLLHSVLASDVVKKSMPARPFRIFYVLFAVLGLLGMLFLNGSIQRTPFFQSTGIIRYVSLMLTTFGVMIIQSSFRQYSLKGFLGLAEEKKELKTDGVLKYVRHPIAAGIALVVLGFFFFIPNLPTLISCLSVAIYLPIGIALEEKKLVEVYGDAYKEYRKKVPALIPFLNI